MNYYKFFLLIVFLIPLFVLAASTQRLPDIGDSAGSTISPEFERRLGQGVMRQVYQYAPIILDPEVEAYIQSIGYKLVANSDDNQLPFIFFMTNNTEINAFAAPGGVVGINSGVLLNSRTESELAGVMAHEISHVTQRHMARTFEKASQLSLPVAAAIIGAIMVGIANPEAGQAALALATGLNAQYQINFTRANEEEADRIGMQLLARSGFDPQGMPGFFERLQQASKFYGRPPEFLSTHPLTSTRIAEAKDRADTYPASEYTDSEKYGLVRAKLFVLAQEFPKDAVKFFEERLNAEDLQDEDRTSVRYGYALALTETGNYHKAREQIKILLNEDSENVTYLLAAARLESAQKNYAAALGIYRESSKLYPEYRPLVLGYAKTLLDAKQPAEARDILRNYGRYHEPDLTFYNLLAQAEAQSGSPVESGIAKAEYYYLSGDTKLAIDRLKYALSQQKLDYYQKERISARQAQLEYELELEEQLEL